MIECGLKISIHTQIETDLDSGIHSIRALDRKRPESSPDVGRTAKGFGNLPGPTRSDARTSPAT